MNDGSGDFMDVYVNDITTNLKLDFSSSPTLWKFLQDKSFVRGVM